MPNSLKTIERVPALKAMPKAFSKHEVYLLGAAK